MIDSGNLKKDHLKVMTASPMRETKYTKPYCLCLLSLLVVVATPAFAQESESGALPSDNGSVTAEDVEVEVADIVDVDENLGDTGADDLINADAESEAEPPADSPLPTAASTASTTASEQAQLEDQSEAIADSADVAAFRQAIDSTEAQGAYAETLSEQLLGLGLALQRQDRHAEAIKVFKRGVHVARINNGLYAGEQVPMLQSEIVSHIATGDYLEADERQTYLYRVQQRTMTFGEERTMALMQQARWQRQAYDMGLGEQSFARLLNMWDLYRLAVTDISEREGENSPNLLKPLAGMMESQYLIAKFSQQTTDGGLNSNDLTARQDQSRFFAYQRESYKRGQAVIRAMYDIEQFNNGDDPVTAAESLTLLGDWMLWHGVKERAFQSYTEAFTELAALDDAQFHIERLFGQPVPLPDFEGVRPLPPRSSAKGADLLLEFGVTPSGRVVDLVRQGEVDDDNSQANRLVRVLRKTRFRPRLEDAEPVATDKLNWAYDTTQW
ncbi:MAG: hypothetical protein ABJ056_09485 [Halioglobus sp.]